MLLMLLAGPPVMLVSSAPLTEPGVHCGWLKAFRKSARNWKNLPSVMWKFLKTERSRLRMPGSGTVLRPALESAPAPAWMYCAFGLLTRWAAVAPLEFVSAGTLLAVLGTPFGLMIARSPALSPFRLE